VSSAATITRSIAALFPPGVTVAELEGPGNADLLLAEEAELVGHAVTKRVREFAAGRMCARLALAEHGVTAVPIKVGQGRQPLWPPGFTGSITHTGEYCAAAVASRAVARSIGIDAEIIGDVKPHLWPSVFSAAEIERLESAAAEQRAAAAAVIFSAKEAFYKCQYPLTAEFLGFHDVIVEGWHERAALERGEIGEFFVRPTRRIAFERHARLPLAGRYRARGLRVTCGVMLGA
jgi:4'-phosphopantetheinyl transferase EntD